MEAASENSSGQDTGKLLLAAKPQEGRQGSIGKVTDKLQSVINYTRLMVSQSGSDLYFRNGSEHNGC